MEEKYIILGAGGHAKVALDILRLNQKNICGFTDAGFQEGDICAGYPVLGTDTILTELFQQGIKNAVMGIGHIGDTAIRNNVYDCVKKIGYIFPNIMHPRAMIAETAQMGEGNLLAAECVLNPEAIIGNLCIINTGAIVEHECVIGNGVHIAPHATVLGAAKIGDNSLVGAGSIILQGVQVGCDCIIGAGSVVVKDVDDNSVIVGSPCKLLKRR